MKKLIHLAKIIISRAMLTFPLLVIMYFFFISKERFKVTQQFGMNQRKSAIATEQKNVTDKEKAFETDIQNNVVKNKNKVVAESYLMTTKEDKQTTQNNKRTKYHSYSTYQYLNQPFQTCKLNGAKKDPYLLIIVKSRVLNIEHRDAIRKTWGSFINSDIKVVYSLGYSPFNVQLVNMEQHKHGDLIQQNYLDTYRNNTLKTVMGFDWVVNTCSGARYVLFIDDDYFLNLPKLLEYLNVHDKNRTGKLAVGTKDVGSGPVRDRKSKWFLSWKDFPSDRFPPYLLGGSIVMDMDVVKRFKSEIPFIKLFCIDDAYLGLVAQSLSIELQNESRFSIKYIPEMLHLVFTAHRFSPPSKMMTEWTRVTCKHHKVFSSFYRHLHC